MPECPDWLWSNYRPVKGYRPPTSGWRLWRPNFALRLKFFVQRHVRGWDDSALWSIDYAIIKYSYTLIKAFRELPPAGVPIHPTEVYPKGHDEEGFPRALTAEEWDDILGEILKCFELALSDAGYSLVGEDHKQLEKSMDLFREWFFALWD